MSAAGLAVRGDGPELAPATTDGSSQPPRRKTPTEKQIAALARLDDDALVARAVGALHALNRRAKGIRDRRNQYRRARFAKALATEIADIYALKDRFLEALVRSDRAAVFVFEVQTTSNERACYLCGRSWFGGAWCYQCDQDSGVAREATRTWYVIDCRDGHRFHQPAVSPAVAARATPIPPHEPTQPQRDIPKIGMTIAAQRRCVEMATERLRGKPDALLVKAGPTVGALPLPGGFDSTAKPFEVRS